MFSGVIGGNEPQKWSGGLRQWSSSVFGASHKFCQEPCCRISNAFQNLLGPGVAHDEQRKPKGCVMGNTRQVGNGLKRGSDRMSTAANEAFAFLNAGIRKHYRGWGDTPTAARDRAAREAGITPAQAERVWKRWRTMASVDGDVYRLLRNKYEALCGLTETAADAMRADRHALKAGRNETDQKRASARERGGALDD